MKRKNSIRIIIVAVLAGAGIADIVRYAQPDAVNKITVLPYKPGSLGTPKEIILVYNAYGGIYPAIVDFIHKEVFPASYPCNLCYQTFGTFTMKKKWKAYLDSLPLRKSFYHKDDFRRKYSYKEALPLILIADEKTTQVLLPAADINRARSPEQLIKMLQARLQP